MRFVSHRRLVTVLIVMMMLAASAQAQQSTGPATQGQRRTAPAAPRAATQPGMTNTDVVNMVGAGLSEQIIIAAIREAKARTFDISANGLIALKKGEVSDAIIAVMLNPNAAPSPTAATLTPAPAQNTSGQAPVVSPATQRLEVSLGQTPTQSVAGREAGIYLETVTGEVQLEPAVFSGGKTGGKFLGGITSLAKSSIKAVVRSSKANQRLQTAVPVFYFYFENKGAGLSNTGGMFTGFMNGASSPNEFVLARMKVDKNERELVTSESWAFSDRSGVRSKDTVDIRVERVSQGVYKVSPQTPLTPGEYCFFYAAGNLDRSGNGKLFDFGVDPGASSQ